MSQSDGSIQLEILVTYSFSFLFKTLHICSNNMQGFAVIFDSQTEKFLSQKGQSTKSTETEYCWLSTQVVCRP